MGARASPRRASSSLPACSIVVPSGTSYALRTASGGARSDFMCFGMGLLSIPCGTGTGGSLRVIRRQVTSSRSASSFAALCPTFSETAALERACLELQGTVIVLPKRLYGLNLVVLTVLECIISDTQTLHISYTYLCVKVKQHVLGHFKESNGHGTCVW